MNEREPAEQRLIDTVLAIDVTLVALLDQLRDAQPGIAMRTVELLHKAAGKIGKEMPGVQAHIEGYCLILTVPPDHPSAH